jgi:phosphate starvation-inducible PhoH-like protein
MVFADGPAGTAKTYLAVQAALKLLKKRAIDSIIYIRSVVESASQKMGSLPGEVDDKFLPWSIPMVEKLDELVGVPTRQNLMKNNLVECVPVNFVRGLTFNDKVVIVDEAQNLTKSEIVTILTRFGERTKYIVVGDTNQSDINGRSGFAPIFECFNDSASEQHGIYTFNFTENEIVRSEILRFIVKQLEKLR